MKCIQKGPDCVMSIKLQEEECEGSDNHVLKVSAIEQNDFIEVDHDTKEILNALDFGNLGRIISRPGPVGWEYSFIAIAPRSTLAQSGCT